MAIEDRVREGLRRTAGHVRGEGQLTEELWEGIDKGIQRARRRQTTMLVATVGSSLAIFAGIMLWVVIAFTGSGRQPAHPVAWLSVERVQVFGTRDGLAKIYGSVSNYGTLAGVVQMSCRVI